MPSAKSSRNCGLTTASALRTMGCSARASGEDDRSPLPCDGRLAAQDRSGGNFEADASRRRRERCSAPPPTGRSAFVAGNPLASGHPRGRTGCRAGSVRQPACARPDRSCLAHGHRLDPDGSQGHAARAGPVGRAGHHVGRTPRSVSGRAPSGQWLACGGDVAHLAGGGSGVAGGGGGGLT